LDLNSQVLLVQPGFDGFGVLFVGLFDPLLRGQTPMCQVVVHRMNGTLESKLKLNVLVHSRSTAQGEVHLELLDPLVADRLADGLFLFSAQAAPTTRFLTPHTGLESVRTTLAVQAQDGVHSGLTPTRLFNQLHHANILAVHADDLLAAFVQHFLRLLAGIFFLHLLLAQTNSISSFINRAWYISSKLARDLHFSVHLC
jgi:hypothetical protein